MGKIPGERTHINVAAIHEAGHALACLREGRQVFSVSVDRDAPGAGLCTHAKRPPNPFNIALGPGSARAAWEHTWATTSADIRISLAGPLAEAYALRKPLRHIGAISDLENCLYMAERLIDLGRYMEQQVPIAVVEPKKLLEAQKTNVRRWIHRTKNWEAIKLIASVLAYNGELDAKVLDYLVSINRPGADHKLVLKFLETI